MVGAVVLRANVEAIRAEVFATQLRAYVTGFALFLVTLIATALVFRWMVARPLVQVNAAMERVARGDYAAEVPARRRSDEIGAIANSLEDFRASLAGAAETNRRALLQGAALDAGSTATIISDSDHAILYANAAANGLFRQLQATLRAGNPGFDPERLVGSRIDRLLAAGGTAAQQGFDQGGRQRADVELTLGEAQVTITVNPILDAAGNRIGQVSEWRDVTRYRKNAAVLEAIDACQVRCEFSPEGRLEFSNGHLCRVLGVAPGALVGQDFRGRIQAEGFDAASGALLTAILRGDKISGRIRVERDASTFAVLDGSFGVVRDKAGKVRSIILLGSDVTEAETARAAAEAARETMQRAQAAVVENLRQGLEQLASGDLTIQLTEVF